MLNRATSSNDKLRTLLFATNSWLKEPSVWSFSDTNITQNKDELTKLLRIALLKLHPDRIPESVRTNVTSMY